MIVLANRYEETKVVEEECAAWVFNVLLALGADEDMLAELDNEDLKEYLQLLEIEVHKKLSNKNVDIFRKDKLVAQWKEPDLILKKDGNEYYYEIHTNEWALPFQMKKEEEYE